MNFSFYPIWKSLRPTHWTKNLFVFAVLIFAPRINDLPLLSASIIAFFCFCLVSSSVYIMNDLADIGDDQHHPVKSLRPIASGQVSMRTAWIVASALLVFSFFTARILQPGIIFSLLGYILLQILYSYCFKHIILVDVFVIAAGFLLRILTGSRVTGLPISHWLLLCTFLLALFLGFSKRRSELQLNHSNPHLQRQVLKRYTVILLDQIITIVTTLIIVTYLLYTVSQETVARFGSIDMVYTTPLVMYGIFRYLFLIYTQHKGENPENNIFSDKPLFFTIILWFLAITYIIYGKP